MPRFEVLAGSVLVGHSDLELVDPSVGMAAGRFVPGPGYAALQPAVVAARDGSQLHLSLRVRTSGGRDLAAENGVQIVDYSEELGAEGLEIHVLGVGRPAQGAA